MPFQSTVDAPRAPPYAAPAVDFGILGDLYRTYQQRGLSEQQKQLNQLAIAQRQAQLEQEQKQRALFAGGLPLDASGNIDYRAVTQALARAGNTDALRELYPAVQAQAAGTVSPLLTGGGAPTPAPAPAPPPGPRGDLPPTSGPLPVAATPSPAGDPGSGTIAAIVAGKVGDEAAGPLMTRIANTMNVDPNATLTPGQQRRAQGLLERYSAATPAPGSESAPTPAPAPAGRTRAPVPPPAEVRAAPVDDGREPLVPQVPLPRGFEDPQRAILALRTEAARLGANPAAAGQVKALNEWATRIEGSLQPLTVQPGQRIISPTGRELYHVPERPVPVGGELVRPDTGEVVYSGGSPLSPQAKRAAGIVFAETGKFPPNMGRGVQGERTRNEIMEEASIVEQERGWSADDRSTRWQQYATHAAGLRVLETRAANMTLVEKETKTLIPRVRALIDTVPRTSFPDLNKIILAGREKTGDPNVVKLGIAIDSLIPVYARLLKPVGQIGVTDTENARHILVKSWADGQMRAALDQMEVERTAAEQALEEARRDFGGGKKREGGGSGGGGAARPPDRVVDGKEYWQIGGKWFPNPEGK